MSLDPTAKSQNTSQSSESQRWPQSYFVYLWNTGISEIIARSVEMGIGTPLIELPPVTVEHLEGRGRKPPDSDAVQGESRRIIQELHSIIPDNKGLHHLFIAAFHSASSLTDIVRVARVIAASPQNYAAYLSMIREIQEDEIALYAHGGRRWPQGSEIKDLVATRRQCDAAYGLEHEMLLNLAIVVGRFTDRTQIFGLFVDLCRAGLRLHPDANSSKFSIFTGLLLHTISANQKEHFLWYQPSAFYREMDPQGRLEMYESLAFYRQFENRSAPKIGRSPKGISPKAEESEWQYGDWIKPERGSFATVDPELHSKFANGVSAVQRNVQVLNELFGHEQPLDRSAINFLDLRVLNSLVMDGPAELKRGELLKMIAWSEAESKHSPFRAELIFRQAFHLADRLHSEGFSSEASKETPRRSSDFLAAFRASIDVAPQLLRRLRRTEIDEGFPGNIPLEGDSPIPRLVAQVRFKDLTEDQLRSIAAQTERQERARAIFSGSIAREMMTPDIFRNLSASDRIGLVDGIDDEFLAELTLGRMHSKLSLNRQTDISDSNRQLRRLHKIVRASGHSLGQSLKICAGLLDLHSYLYSESDALVSTTRLLGKDTAPEIRNPLTPQLDIVCDFFQIFGVEPLPATFSAYYACRNGLPIRRALEGYLHYATHTVESHLFPKVESNIYRINGFFDYCSSTAKMQELVQLQLKRLDEWSQNLNRSFVSYPIILTGTAQQILSSFSQMPEPPLLFQYPGSVQHEILAKALPESFEEMNLKSAHLIDDDSASLPEWLKRKTKTDPATQHRYLMVGLGETLTLEDHALPIARPVSVDEFCEWYRELRISMAYISDMIETPLVNPLYSEALMHSLGALTPQYYPKVIERIVSQAPNGKKTLLTSDPELRSADNLLHLGAALALRNKRNHTHQEACQKLRALPPHSPVFEFDVPARLAVDGTGPIVPIVERHLDQVERVIDELVFLGVGERLEWAKRGTIRTIDSKAAERRGRGEEIVDFASLRDAVEGSASAHALLEALQAAPSLQPILDLRNDTLRAILAAWPQPQIWLTSENQSAKERARYILYLYQVARDAVADPGRDDFESLQRLFAYGFRLEGMASLFDASLEDAATEYPDSLRIAVAPTPGLPLGLMGWMLDSCVTRIPNPVDSNPRITLFPFCVARYDELNAPIFQGGTGLITGELTENCHALMIRGFNPRAPLSDRVRLPLLFESFLNAIEKYARETGHDYIIAPYEEFAGGALSNFQEIVNFTNLRYGKNVSAMPAAAMNSRSFEFNGIPVRQFVILRDLLWPRPIQYSAPMPSS